MSNTSNILFLMMIYTNDVLFLIKVYWLSTHNHASCQVSDEVADPDWKPFESEVDGRRQILLDVSSNEFLIKI